MVCIDLEGIAERVKEIREAQLNMSQERLAEVLEYSPATVKRAESPTYGLVDTKFYVLLAELAGMSLDELLLGRKEPVVKKKQVKKINYLLEHVTDDELDYIYVAIDNFIRFIHKDEYSVIKAFKKYMKKIKK